MALNPEAESNWGRWGPSDETGALNHLTPELVMAAIALVETGQVLSLGQVLGPDTVVPSHRKTVERFLTRHGRDHPADSSGDGFRFAEDVLSFATHSGTHIDALSHVWYDDQLYNGFRADSIKSTTGANHCGAERLTPIVTRGVLMDLVRMNGRPLGMGEAVTRGMLESCASSQDLTLRAGDAVLIRTGWFETHGHDPEAYMAGEPGIDLGAAEWLAHADVSIVGADNFAIEVMPFVDGRKFPAHRTLIRDYGTPLLEGCVLEELAGHGVTVFLFIASPVPVVGSTAAMVRPLAIL